MERTRRPLFVLHQFLTSTVCWLIAFATVAPFACAQTYTVLHRFSAREGAHPHGGLFFDSEGHVHGIGTVGGRNKMGTVFSLSRTQRSVYSFTGPDGAFPLSELVEDSAGNLYGTTAMGGYGGGTVFKITPSGGETVLVKFSDPQFGNQPQSSLVLDSEGNLYGTTLLGGINFRGSRGLGTVFEITSTGTLITLYRFTGLTDPDFADGEFPYAGLCRDQAGNLFGTTGGDGSTTWGTVFEATEDGGYAILYRFKGRSDGSQPMAALTLDTAGNLYGTTKAGGVFDHGTVFKLDTNHIQSVLYSFTGGTDGGRPQSAVVFDSLGNLYGTTVLGGTSNRGTVYKLDLLGNEIVLHSFEGGTDGEYPYSGLMQDSRGHLYGVTSGGGAGHGVIFEITP